MSFTITITLTFPTRNEESDDFKSYEKRAKHAPKFDHVLKENLDGAFDDDIVSSDIASCTISHLCLFLFKIIFARKFRKDQEKRKF